MDTFKDRLRILMAQNNLSAADLSRKTNISKQTLSNWLGGHHPRDIKKIKKVSDQLNTSLDFLLFGNATASQSVDLQSILDSGQSIRGTFDVEIRLVQKK